MGEEVVYSVSIITISDSTSRGERTDESGPAIRQVFENEGWKIVSTSVVGDESEFIKQAIIKESDISKVNLVITTGGTGFSVRDITPEATLEVIERLAPGLSEAMRVENLKITPRAMLSRGVSGIRKSTLIINLPGSKKAALESLGVVLKDKTLEHAIKMMLSKGSTSHPKVSAVCISEAKGTQKYALEEVHLKKDHGIEGDAHAGNWHRQVSLLDSSSVKKIQDVIDFELLPGAFAENILTEGMNLPSLPIGSKLQIGNEVLLEVTQIGKECHNDCIIRQKAGDCVMPREGIFAIVLNEGTVKAGDEISVH
jgi:molybdenum cofactor synthesis domain-containing protein